MAVTTTNGTVPQTTSKQHCIGGTMQPGVSEKYLDLCQFACNFDYCPPDQCVCTQQADQPVPTPATTGQKGCPLPNEDDSYLGLCSFSCDHGYCPPTTCTSNCSS